MSHEGNHVIAGVLTAALSPLAMTVGFILWGEAWQSSAYALNLFKCTLAGMIFLVVACSIRLTIPVTASDQSMIILSSILGIVIGDNTWLLALQMIGAKRVIVIDTLKPFLAAVLGSLVLQEPFTIAMACGIIISSVGIVLVSLEKEGQPQQKTAEIDPFDQSVHSTPPSSSSSSSTPNERAMLDEEDTVTSESTSKLTIGYILAGINVFLDAIGSVLTKQYGTELNTWEINFLRFGFASIMMAFIAGLAYVVESFYSKSKTQSSPNPQRSRYRVLNPLTDVDRDEEQTFEMSIVGSSVHGQDDEEVKVVNQFEAKFRSQEAQSKYLSEALDKNKKKSDTTPMDHVWYKFPAFEDMKVEQWLKVIVGVLFVTFTCPALSNYALFQIPLGLCLTLTSLGPVYSIPLVYLMSGEKTGTQGMLGAVLAVLGVGIMFSTS